MTMTVETGQSLAALADANRKRHAMLTIRQEISQLPLAEGRLLVAAILVGDVESPAAEALTVWRLLNAVRRLGPSRIERWLRLAGVITGDKRVRDLTNRQRVAIAAQLRGEDPA